MAIKAYNLTDDVARLVELLAARVPGLAHVRHGQVLHGVSQARTRTKYGTYAQCHALRFKHGRREQRTRDGHAWQWPVIRVGGHEILYYVTYFLPRFLDQPPAERLHTLVHELCHISPKFDGDLRRYAGRNEFHGHAFERLVEAAMLDAGPHVEAAAFPFLVYSFDELVARFGGVVGNRLKRFHPKRVRLEELPTNLAHEPQAPRQLALFPDT